MIYNAFSNVSDNFDQRTIWFDPCYILRVLSKKNFFESRTKWFDPYCPFKTLKRFIINPLIFLCFKYFQEIWIRDNMVWPILKVLIIFLTKVLIWLDLIQLFSLGTIWAKKQSSNFVFWSKQVFWSKHNIVWPIMSFIIILMFFMKTFFLVLYVSSIKFCSKDNTVWPLQ